MLSIDFDFDFDATMSPVRDGKGYPLALVFLVFLVFLDNLVLLLVLLLVLVPVPVPALMQGPAHRVIPPREVLDPVAIQPLVI